MGPGVARPTGCNTAGMLMPPIDRYVTRAPWTIDADSTLANAHDVMHAHQVRHLPVMADDKLVGIVSERDLYLLRAIAGVNMHETRVREAMNAPVYTVASGTPLDQVVAEMSEHKYGSVVVLGANAAIGGIFTTVDACRVLAELVQRAVG